jgi:HEPN domain-containing protein
MLLRKSAEDEQITQLDGIPHSIFGFHAQQAIEKLLKALLAQKAIRYPRTHDLELLEEQLKDSGEIPPATPVALKELVDYAVELRYDDSLLSNTPDRAQIRATVRIVREFVNRRIAEIDQTPGGGTP